MIYWIDDQVKLTNFTKKKFYFGNGDLSKRESFTELQEISGIRDQNTIVNVTFIIIRI